MKKSEVLQEILLNLKNLNDENFKNIIVNNNEIIVFFTNPMAEKDAEIVINRLSEKIIVVLYKLYSAKKIVNIPILNWNAMEKDGIVNGVKVEI